MVEKKAAAVKKAAPSHPPYAKMITEAIVAVGGMYFREYHIFLSKFLLPEFFIDLPMVNKTF